MEEPTRDDTHPARRTGRPALPDDGLGAAAGRRSRPVRLLLAAALAETLTLAVLLVNVALPARSATLAAALGPLHGALYLAGVLLTWTAPFARVVKVLAVVPVLGAWLAVRASGPRARPSRGPRGSRRPGRSRRSAT